MLAAYGFVGALLTTGLAAAGPVDGSGSNAPGAAYPAGEDERQFAVLANDLKQRSLFKKHEPETYRRESLIWDSDRDPLDVILRRMEALLADLRSMPKPPTLAGPAAELAALRAQADKTDVTDAPARRALFDKACRLRRRIAFANPLLDFTELLFLKRHLSTYNHMCDQYYGITQRPGGGIFILSDPFGPKPIERDVLANSAVANGRLKGRKLSCGAKDGGSFLSPDLSFDARTIAFAYVECEGDARHASHTDPSRGHWSPGRSYHVFKVGVDGSNLTMLTDGTWNDFDPCFMPSGRIAFISERRGGYLRCGRVCPTYTLYDMAPDGSDVRCLSYHETNEWHPSVANDGMIVWTRWDYVDRHGQVVHLAWLTTPDGRDPRPVHGNYAVRSKRPDMEVDVRAIPGSNRFVGTAAPHHNQAFGSLILIDPKVRDDDGAAPVRRLTPDCGFPESQGGGMLYGQPWPLSETYFLCSYAPPAQKKGSKGGRTYELYLVDAFGNKDLIYQDPEIACHNPMPFRPRPAPSIIPQQVPPAAATPPAEGAVAVMNVYESLKPWPAETRIRALRVVQILPLSIPSQAVTHATGLQLPEGTDSINLARAVLGTAPVETDGSAFFTVPARKEFFFQALDENGLAVQSMRSGTHVHPGERLTCAGCHEPKYAAPPQPKTPPMALRRPPSRLLPDVDGTNPFSYPRLVQPVLDRHCVACHAKNAEKKAPRLDAQIVQFPPRGSYMNPSTRYFASYVSLAPKFGFWSYGAGGNWGDERFYRTIPGQFGARASKLYALLKQGHYDVKLPPEDLHRITVWLDMCSIFYGVYEKEGGEAILRGEVTKPTLE
jgi:cytochrome c553